ncbi:MAG TPA: glycosyltransferase family 4 protein [Candidatus Methanoperedens sp.]
MVAPAHATLKNDYGSEISWSYELIKGLYAMNLNICAIFNYKYINNSNDIFRCGKIITLSNKKIIHPDLSNIFIFNIRYFFVAMKLIKREKFDLVHHMLPFAYGKTFNLIPFFGYTKEIPFIIGPLQQPLNFDDTAFRGLTYYFLRLVNPILFFLSKKTLEKADALICVNEDAKTLFSKIVNKDKPIFIIPPGIDINRFGYTARKEKNNIEIISVAYLQKRKGIDFIIKAFSEIIGKRPNIMLRVVGMGPEKENLMGLVNQLNLNRHVIFEGFVPNTEIAKYYQNADIFISMSCSESFGQTSIEAMATGLPVITTKVGEIKNIIVHGETGFLIEHNKDELKNYLVKLIDDRRLRNIMGQNARKIVEEKYDWKIIAKKYYELYLNLAS